LGRTAEHSPVNVVAEEIVATTRGWVDILYGEVVGANG
jgi:hypothetical protein